MAEEIVVSAKRCNKGEACIHEGGPLQPLENFSKRQQSPDGHTYTCKDCEKKQAKDNYFLRKAQGKIVVTPEEKEQKKQFYRDYYLANKDHRRQYDQQYRGTDEGKKALQEGHSRRRDRQKDQAGAPYERWQVIEKDTVEGVLICGICKKPIIRVRDMQLDHIISIAQGGKDELKNVRCVHTACNLSRPKGIKEG